MQALDLIMAVMESETHGAIGGGEGPAGVTYPMYSPEACPGFHSVLGELILPKCFSFIRIHLLICDIPIYRSPYPSLASVQRGLISAINSY